MKDKISAMIEAAIGGDGFVSIMGKSSPGIRQDIPAAFEAYTLLSHFIGRLPVHPVTLDATNPLSDLSPAILHDATAARLVALLPICAGELTAVAYWITDSVRSDQVKQMAGVLALPFSIETPLTGVEVLLPEWFAAFYVDADPGHCIPILALRAVLADERFGDWVSVALERMAAFGLPQEQAGNAVRGKEPQHEQCT